MKVYLVIQLKLLLLLLQINSIYINHSLKEDYEVTGVEMDVLAEEAQGLDGVLGSRITGGGFGGCTVSLVREDAVDAFVRRLGEIYTGKVGLRAEFYVADIGDGARKIC